MDIIDQPQRVVSVVEIQDPETLVSKKRPDIWIVLYIRYAIPFKCIIFTEIKKFIIPIWSQWPIYSLK